jgi:hypothetical protein
MILHVGERVYWGAPEVIYLEGAIIALDEKEQAVVVHIDRATPYSAHLIGADVSFAANGVRPLLGASPPGTTSERSTERMPPRVMSDAEKIRSAAAALIRQKYGYDLPTEQENALIGQVEQTINTDPTLRQQIITSMDEILRREF